MTRTVALPTLLALATSAAAGQQPAVVPASLAGVEAPSSTSIPFAFNRSARWQNMYDAVELPWTGPRILNGMRIRPDNSVPGTTTQPLKQFLQVYLTVSTTTDTAFGASPTFEDNLGGDATQVIDNARLSLPAVGPVATGPMPFAIDLPFDRPWVFDTSPVRGSGSHSPGFMFDMRIEVQPSGSYILDSPGSCAIPAVPFGNAAGCLTSAGAPMGFSASSAIQAGGSVTYTVSGMPAGFPFWVVTSAERPMAGNPPLTQFGRVLPFELTAANLAGLGLAGSAPGCYFEIPFGGTLGGTIDTSGNGQVVLGVPSGRQFVGVPFYAQAAGFDPGANSLFFVTSNGLESRACGPLSIARVFTFATQPSLLGPTGSVNVGNAAVIELR